MAPESEEDALTVNVLVVGPSKSGKTVYLASMFRYLGVQDPRIGAMLTTDQNTRTHLLDGVYATVANPAEDWPASTKPADAREYLFDCKTRYKGHNWPLLRIRYLDYAGELLTDASADESSSHLARDLEQRVYQAHTVLCLLDGQKILSMARGEEDGLQHFHTRMSSIFGLLQQVEKPVHFVVTKWDLLSGLEETEQKSLARVRDELMAVRDFALLVDNAVLPGALAVPAVRLIPVSAVGHGYVRPLENGRMEKIRGRVPQPLHVEVPLLAVLPDLFTQVFDSLDEATRRQLTKALQAETKLTPGERAKWIAGIIGGRLTKVVTGTVSAVTGKGFEKATETAVNALTASLRERGDLKLTKREEGLGAVEALTEEAAAARRIAVEQMNSALTKFVQDLPASVLRDGQPS